VDTTINTPTVFKWRHFQGDIIVLCLRWYLRYSPSYRDLEEMMAERRLKVDTPIISGPQRGDMLPTKRGNDNLRIGTKL